MPVFFVEDTEGIIGEPQSKFFLLRLKAWLNENLNPSGAVCHTGADTCFNETNKAENFLSELKKVIRERKLNPQENSYTSELFQKGLNKIAQKISEEAIELIIEAKDDNIELFRGEAADLLYHFLVLLQAKNLELNDVLEVLEQRRKP